MRSDSSQRCCRQRCGTDAQEIPSRQICHGLTLVLITHCLPPRCVSKIVSCVSALQGAITNHGPIVLICALPVPPRPRIESVVCNGFPTLVTDSRKRPSALATTGWQPLSKYRRAWPLGKDQGGHNLNDDHSPSASGALRSEQLAQSKPSILDPLSGIPRSG